LSTTINNVNCSIECWKKRIKTFPHSNTNNLPMLNTPETFEHAMCALIRGAFPCKYNCAPLPLRYSGRLRTRFHRSSINFPLFVRKLLDVFYSLIYTCDEKCCLDIVKGNENSESLLKIVVSVIKNQKEIDSMKDEKGNFLVMIEKQEIEDEGMVLCISVLRLMLVISLRGVVAVGGREERGEKKEKSKREECKNIFKQVFESVEGAMNLLIDFFVSSRNTTIKGICCVCLLNLLVGVDLTSYKYFSASYDSEVVPLLILTGKELQISNKEL
jgi:hypothetical protein